MSNESFATGLASLLASNGMTLEPEAIDKIAASVDNDTPIILRGPAWVLGKIRNYVADFKQEN